MINQAPNSTYFHNFRSEMADFVPVTAKKILEIGCGEGVFAEFIKKRNNAHVTGIELSETAGKIAEEKLDKVFVGDIHSILPMLRAEHFDCIICNDVLEHLYDPYSVLEELHNILDNQGVVVSSIPNVRFLPNLIKLLVLKNWDYTDHGILDRTHVRFFTSKSIQKMYANAGYKILSHTGINKLPFVKFFPFLLLSGGSLYDTQFLQFATVAQRQ